MRNKPKRAAKSNVTTETLGETLRLKDSPSRDALRKTKSPVSKLVRKFQ